MLFSSPGAANTPAYTTIPIITRNRAGRRRLARRSQNPLRSMRSRFVHSVTRSVVMRNPLRTKNVSTPRYPPTAHV